MINILEGIRVVETASFFMGPIAGRILADWGAEVIKIETATSVPPHDGDRVRGTGMARGIVNGDPCCNEFVNGNKKSVGINTFVPAGRKLQQELCASADIVIHHMRPQDAKKLGLDYATLSAKNPGIIVACTSGYGLKGPVASRGGFDATAYAARSGMVTDCTSDGKPFIPFMGYGDVPAGTYLATAILAAYVNKLKTGKGEEVTTALYGSAIWTAGIPIMTAQYGDKYPTPREAVFPTTKAFKCADGKYIYLMGQVWESVIDGLCKIMDMPKGAKKKWPNYFAASASNAEITAILDEQFIQHDRDYWEEKLATTKIPFEIVNSFADVQKDEQAWKAGFLVKPEDSPYETGIPVAPGHFKSQGDVEVKTVNVGENTREQLKELGYSDEKIDGLRSKGVISEGDQFESDRFDITKPGTYYNKVFSQLK
ncbi:MAG: CaiB/BaiF CoA-transferase family protein [Hespellia sp.]|nr:CaiB/BaiF CoA-transferase family protein [Hespellia sp.]